MVICRILGLDVEKMTFFSKMLSAKTKQNNNFFYIFESKTTFASDQIHIWAAVKNKKNTIFSTFFTQNYFFEWSNPFLAVKKTRKTRYSEHFWVKNDIFEWSNPHFRCKSQQKRVFLTKKKKKIRIFDLKIVFGYIYLRKGRTVF